MFEVISSQRPLGTRSAAASALAHAAAIFLAFTVGGRVATFVAHPRHVTLVAPPAPRVEPQPFRPVLHTPARPKIAVVPPVAPKLSVPKIEIPQAPKIEVAHVPVPETPRVDPVVIPAPKPVLHLGDFNSVAQEAPRVAAKPTTVASGFAAVDHSTSHTPRGSLAQSTGFESAELAQQGSRNRTIQQTGFGTEVAAAQQAPKRAIQQGGFGNDAPAAPAKPVLHASIQKGGFGDTVREDPSAPARKTAAAASSPVEILAKPRPAYTAEARKLGLEGEVLVEVVFEASGSVRVSKVLKGLGHGLDESALQAARDIQFRPARRDGQPVDSTAVVHIVFQLTY